jgi:hypothetical protein
VQVAQAVAELLADRRQPYVAAVSGEESGADGAFLLLDRLADRRHGDVCPLRRPTEVQLLGEGQEDLDVA